MKVAIYGDSFASNFEGWPSHLKNLLNSKKVTIFAEGGTSANFSYMKFLETHKKYDVVIFLWTSITRNCLITKDPNNKKYSIHGFSNSNYHNKMELKDLISEYIMSMNRKMTLHLPQFSELDEKWIVWESVYSSKYPSKNFLENRAMRDSVKLTRPDAINVECFSNPEFSESGMSEISKYDWCQTVSRLEIHDKSYLEGCKMRPNHLSLKQNKEFAEYLYKHMNTDNFDIHKTFAKPEKFYTMSQNLEESGFIV